MRPAARRWDRAGVLDAVRRCAADIGHGDIGAIVYMAWAGGQGDAAPAFLTVVKVLGSWAEALSAAGLIGGDPADADTVEALRDAVADAKVAAHPGLSADAMAPIVLARLRSRGWDVVRTAATADDAAADDAEVAAPEMPVVGLWHAPDSCDAPWVFAGALPVPVAPPEARVAAGAAVAAMTSGVADADTKMWARWLAGHEPGLAEPGYAAEPRWLRDGDAVECGGRVWTVAVDDRGRGAIDLEMTPAPGWAVPVACRRGPAPAFSPGGSNVLHAPDEAGAELLTGLTGRPVTFPPGDGE